MNRLALALLLLASLTAPAWPGIHAALHAHESDAIAHADFDHDAHVHAVQAHLGIAHDPAHGHEHPELASVVGTRTAPPAILACLPMAFLDFASVETVQLHARNESPPPHARPERGAPDRPRGPPSI
jgi:hypothetical protein